MCVNHSEHLVMTWTVIWLHISQITGWQIFAPHLQTLQQTILLWLQTITCLSPIILTIYGINSCTRTTSHFHEKPDGQQKMTKSQIVHQSIPLPNVYSWEVGGQSDSNCCAAVSTWISNNKLSIGVSISGKAIYGIMLLRSRLDTSKHPSVNNAACKLPY